MASPNLDLVELFLVLFFLNLNQHGQVENSQKKKMLKNEIKEDTLDEGCKDKPNDDTLEDNDQPEIVPATKSTIDMIPTKVQHK